MADDQGVSARTKEALDLAARCFETESSEGYEVLNEQLEQLESLARETFQAHTDYNTLVSTLEQGKPLTPDQLNTLKLLIVGDADYYLKYDEEFDRCKSELKRIVDEIRRLPLSDLDVDALMHLRVLCHEASSVLMPTSYYLEQKERLQKFQEATRGPIERESGQTLAHMIKQMMVSGEM